MSKMLIKFINICLLCPSLNGFDHTCMAIGFSYKYAISTFVSLTLVLRKV